MKYMLYLAEGNNKQGIDCIICSPLCVQLKSWIMHSFAIFFEVGRITLCFHMWNFDLPEKMCGFTVYTLPRLCIIKMVTADTGGPHIRKSRGGCKIGWAWMVCNGVVIEWFPMWSEVPFQTQKPFRIHHQSTSYLMFFPLFRWLLFRLSLWGPRPCDS